jgi:hypothetical protein
MIISRIIIILIILFLIFIFCNNKESFQSNTKSNNVVFKEIMILYLNFLKKYVGIMKELHITCIKIINFIGIGETKKSLTEINSNSSTLIINLSKIYELSQKIQQLSYDSTLYEKSSYKKINQRLKNQYISIRDNKKKILDLFATDNTQECKELSSITDKKLMIFLYSIPGNNSNIEPLEWPVSEEAKDYNITHGDTPSEEYTNLKKLLISDTIQVEPMYDFFKYLKENTVDKCSKMVTSSSIVSLDTTSDANDTTLKGRLQNTANTLINKETEIGYIINELNNPSTIYIDEESGKNFFDISNKNNEIENKFCEKLQKLDKPNKKNLIFKRFSQDVIEKKKNYINKLEDKIKELYKKQTDHDIYNTNIDRISSHNVSSKKYNAIIKGIDNIKNRNKVKINLT